MKRNETQFDEPVTREMLRRVQEYANAHEMSFDDFLNAALEALTREKENGCQ